MSHNQKMRDVLKSASERLRKATESERFGVDVLYLVGCMRSVAQELDSALAAPPEPIGNNAEMRKTLETVLDELLARSPNILIRKIETPPWVVELGVIIATALNAPPRNCDKFSKAEVLKLLDDRSFSKEDTIDWLYAEAKGEVK